MQRLSTWSPRPEPHRWGARGWQRSLGSAPPGTLFLLTARKALSSQLSEPEQVRSRAQGQRALAQASPRRGPAVELGPPHAATGLSGAAALALGFLASPLPPSPANRVPALLGSAGRTG